ncbi:MAG TPA: YceI family protein [Acidimicrobiales bacterium]|nr:YceI family protein [Acidimicrobiales bacterium]
MGINKREIVAPLKFTFDSSRSRVWVNARSNLHPINTETSGITGWIEASVLPSGGLDVDTPVAGRLELATDHLSSGNHLYDREMKRRIDAHRFPVIEGEIVSVQPGRRADRYTVAGDVSFHGRTRRFEHEMTIAVYDGSRIELAGDYVFDIREFDMKPPSMLMLKVYPEVAVRIELIGTVDE